MDIGVFGASGYVGGVLLTLLLNHPETRIVYATSRRYANKPVFKVHPHLRKASSLKFIHPEEALERDVDLAFTALPHKSSADIVVKLYEKGIRVVDLSADFRLKNPEAYKIWYNWEHPYPDMLSKATHGFPEFFREDIRNSRLVSVPGCMANASILALIPIVERSLIDPNHVVIDAKIGSSGAGASPTQEGYHPERYNVVRPYKPVGHRHTGEIIQMANLFGNEEYRISFTPHSVNMVRGILTTIHVFLRRDIDLKVIWSIYRERYSKEPFVRIVRDPTIVHGLPDPKYLIGSNYCDIGFDIDRLNHRLVLFSAVDNLMKGAAGNAIQCMNIMLGFDETLGLKSPGVHPV